MVPKNEIELTKTGLCVRDGCFLKQTASGQVIARHALSDIQNVELVRTWDTTGFVLVPALASLAAVAWLYIPWNGWRWAAAILLWGLAGIFVTGLKDSKLRLHTRRGSINYAIKDEADEAHGFMMTLLDLLEERKGG